MHRLFFCLLRECRALRVVALFGEELVRQWCRKWKLQLHIYSGASWRKKWRFWRWELLTHRRGSKNRASQLGAQEKHKLSLGRFFLPANVSFVWCWWVIIKNKDCELGTPDKIIIFFTTFPRFNQIRNSDPDENWFPNIKTHCARYAVVPQILGLEILRTKDIHDQHHGFLNLVHW